MQYVEHRDFRRSLSELYNMGGQPKKHAEKVQALLGRIGREKDPFKGFKVTNWGETRIKHCVKYDLDDGYRLVTIQDDGSVLFCFVGNHDAEDRWLNGHSGMKLSKDAQGVIQPVYVSDSDEGTRIKRQSDLVRGTLLDRFSESRQNELLCDLPPAVIRRLGALDENSRDNDIFDTLKAVETKKAGFVYDVMCLLLAGKVMDAERRVDFEYGRITPMDQIPLEDRLEIQSGDEIRVIRVGSEEHAEWLKKFASSSTYYDWLLFMHPEQTAVVDAEFNGPAQLSGVSGSGKTCVAVKRAIRLAKANKSALILILTLNRALAGLIKNLVENCVEDSGVQSRISVISFFELCQKLLAEFEPKNTRLYNDVTWKHEEHVDEIFREYYRRWLNNPTASVLDRVHQSLVSRGVFAEEYVREEFDWLRSAVSKSSRRDYLQMERIGRKLPISEEWRSDILEGLGGWEKKMADVGVIDYLGLTTELSRHTNKLRPRYDHIIVDEAQDFGTTELAVVRALAKPGSNDIFLCGDIAQHVLPKNRVLAQAAISVSGRTRKICRNYRNSREILSAAYAVLIENLDETMLEGSDLELLDPIYANRSSPKPCVLQARSLPEEIAYARTLAVDHLKVHQDARCCIAFSGYSLAEVAAYAKANGLPVLSGDHNPNSERLVLSDLEQTKGYEFHLMIIVNSSENILPPDGAPEEEKFRHGCQLYVAMTRARDELYLSYSGAPSQWLVHAGEKLSFLEWGDVCAINERYISAAPVELPEIEKEETFDVGRLSGQEFLFTKYALGLSPEALSQIYHRVDGIGLRSQDASSVRWRDMEALLKDLNESPRARNIIGSRVQSEIRKRLDNLIS